MIVDDICRQSIETNETKRQTLAYVVAMQPQPRPRGGKIPDRGGSRLRSKSIAPTP